MTALKIIASLAFVIIVPLGVRSCLLSEGNWITCRLRTTAGEIQFRVYPDKVPLTAANFLRYVEAGLYNGSTFFRVVTPDNQPNNPVKIEVIQGGDVDEKKCFPPVAHETTARTGLTHKNGTVSMARDAPGTATSSFFICIGRQPELDFGGRRNPDGQGFAAFGRVVKGMEVVRKIQRMDRDGQYLKKPVLITSLIRLMKPSELPANTGSRPWRKAGIGVIWEAIRAGFERMTFTDYATLFLVLAVLGWLGWHGLLSQRWARGESPAWEGSSWASGRRDLESAPSWLRVLGLVFFLLFITLLALILIGGF
ncbi:MAG: peptidylprolyl isomerase [Candidatus Aminicenantes bacterium]|nr:peptidylprolyl isomerase [Candidatus Aminicenantes bacterium]